MPVRANNTPQPLSPPFTQTWSNTGLITANDNWSGVPGIVGFLGDYTTSSPTGVDPQTLLQDMTTVDVIANQGATTTTSPNNLTNGGVAEFDGIADPTVALNGSGTADAPNVVFYLNTTGFQSINVAYDLRDLDGSADDAAQQFALQYRVGNSGNYTNLPAGYVADATAPGTATLVTPVSVTLPAAANNQPLVQVRVMTTNAAGNDEWVGVDNIVVSGTPISGNTAPTINAPANPAATVNQDAPPFTVGLTGSDDNGVYVWSATAGTGISSVAVSAGQGTSSVTYTVTLQSGFSGTATFTASLSDGVNAPATQLVNIQVQPNVPNNPPAIDAPANPAATVNQDAAPFNVNLTGSDDNSVYNWSATPGAGVSSAVVTAGQGTAGVTYTVTLQPGFSGTATFTASLSDGVNAPATQAVNIAVTPAPVNHVTISQIYGGGGNTNATFSHDYVELYNPTNASVNLTGWSVQYSPTTNTSWTGVQSLIGTIGPGEYYLVRLGTNNSNVGAPLPTPNVEGNINLSGTTGEVALVNNSNTLPAGCPTGDASLVDLVGYGTSATCRETANAPAPSNTTAIFRAAGGATDTGNNANDFSVGAPNPRRTAPIFDAAPTVTDVDTDTELVENAPTPRDGSFNVFFSESVEVTGAWYDINCTMTGAHTAVVYNGPRNWIVTPDVNFQPGEQCTFKVFAAAVKDADTNDDQPNTDQMQADYTEVFTVASGNPAPETQDVHLLFGNPTDAVADLNQPNNYLMEKPEFTLSYNRDRGTPNWVSWHLSDDWTGFLSRQDTFRPDPAVPVEWNRVLNTDYSGSGFDRGHVVASADRAEIGSVPLNQATFLMTNMIPQAPNNNQQTWNFMEQDLRDLAEDDGKELYIVAGGAGIGGSGSNGGVTTTIANGKVTVPAFTWKVVLVLDKAAGDDIGRVNCSTRTIAVIVPNKQGTNPDWTQYLTSVDAVETLTTYNFFENLPDPVERCVEAGVNGNNPELDTDDDGTPDSTDTDDDNDGVSDADETAAGSDPLNPNSTPEVCDGVDNDLNEGTDEGFPNNDNDGAADCVDTDDDNDGVPDTTDAFPFDPNESVDTDNDGIGNNADTDDDNDGQTDADEIACGSDSLSASSKSTDTDGDNSPNCVDADDDNDGVNDVLDNCDFNPNPGQEDFDLDGIGDACDNVTGPPTLKEQCMNGGWERFDSPREFKNQGDCIQFVNTEK